MNSGGSIQSVAWLPRRPNAWEAPLIETLPSLTTQQCDTEGKSDFQFRWEALGP